MDPGSCEVSSMISLSPGRFYLAVLGSDLIQREDGPEESESFTYDPSSDILTVTCRTRSHADARASVTNLFRTVSCVNEVRAKVRDLRMKK